MVRVHPAQPNKKAPERLLFCLVGILTSGGSQPPAGGTSASLKCGRNLRFPHKRPLPGRFHEASLGIAKELPAARRAFFHRGNIPLCGGMVLRCRSKAFLLSPIDDVGRCHSACRVFCFSAKAFRGLPRCCPPPGAGVLHIGPEFAII